MLPDALDHSTPADSAPTLPNVQCPSTRVTFPLAADHSRYSVSAPRCRPPWLGGLITWFTALIAPHTMVEASEVMTESSWHIGRVATGEAELEAGRTTGTDGLGTGVEVPRAWLITVSASRLSASRLLPPLARSRSHTPVCIWSLPSQLKASVRSLSVQDSALASSGSKPMRPSAVQVRTAPVASVITLTLVRLGPGVSLAGSSAMASFLPSGDRANPVISCPARTDMGNRFTLLTMPVVRLRTSV